MSDQSLGACAAVCAEMTYPPISVSFGFTDSFGFGTSHQSMLYYCQILPAKHWPPQLVVGTSGTKTRSKAPQHWTTSWTNCGLTLRIGAYNLLVII